MINAKDFTFCGEKLSDYGFVIADVGSGSDVETLASGNVQINTVTLPSYRKNIIHGKQYGEPLQLTFQVIRMDEHCSPLTVTDNEYDAIKRWLERDTYNYLNFDNEDIYFNTLISASALRVNGSIIGFELTTKCDSGYSYGPEITTSLSSGSNTFTDNSALTDYTYPILTITCTTSGQVKIVNEFDNNRAMTIDNCIANEVITIDCEHKTIVSSRSGHDLSSDFNFKFFRYLNTRNSRINTITVTNASVVMKHRFTRMVAR